MMKIDGPIVPETQHDGIEQSQAPDEMSLARLPVLRALGPHLTDGRRLALRKLLLMSMPIVRGCVIIQRGRPGTLADLRIAHRPGSPARHTDS